MNFNIEQSIKNKESKRIVIINKNDRKLTYYRINILSKKYIKIKMFLDEKQNKKRKALAGN